MANSALLQMKAFVEVVPGMRVFYDCPAMSTEDYDSNLFFKKNRGKIGTVVRFAEKFVGPLDAHGRMPGVYIDPAAIHVQFEGEEEVHRLNLNHFVLYDVGQTDVPTARLDHQKVCELPEPLVFWPGDIVRKADDLLCVARTVEDVSVGAEGTVAYVLAETVDAQKQRQMKNDAEISRRRESAKSGGRTVLPLTLGLDDRPRTERCKAGDLVLVDRGNIFHLYHDPSKLAFASPEEEVVFWGKDGISSIVYGGDDHMSRWEWPLEVAKKMVANGEGDLVIAAQRYKNIVVTGRGGEFKVRKLLACFAENRDRVRALSLNMAEPPVEERVHSGKMFSALLGD